MLYLIAASILTLTTLADLESVTEEWIAPGVDITKETLVEFADHGEMFQSASEPYVGCHVTFVEVEGQEKWRAVVVYADRVVLFQEDQEPVVTLHDFPVDNCSFSESGNYVVLHDGGEVDTDRNGLRINAETRERTYFDSQPDGLLGGNVPSIWDDGRMKFARNIGYLTYKYFFLSTDLSCIYSRPIYLATLGASSQNYSIMAFEGSFHCYNSNWEEIWTFELPSNGAYMANPVISEENACFILATQEDIQVRTLASADLLYTYTMPPRSFPRQVFLNSESTAFSCHFLQRSEEYNQNFSVEHLRIDGRFDDPNQSFISPTFLSSSTGYSIQGYSDNCILIPLRQENQRTWTYILFDSSYNTKYILPTELNLYDLLVSDQGNRAEATITKNGNCLLMVIDDKLIMITLYSLS